MDYGSCSTRRVLSALEESFTHLHNLYLEQLYPVSIKQNLEIAAIRLIHLFDVARHFSQESLLYPSFHNPGIFLVCVIVQMGCDDGSADATGSIDDLFDARHTESDMCSIRERKSQGLKAHISHLKASSPFFSMITVDKITRRHLIFKLVCLYHNISVRTTQLGE